ncbi:MAG: hypothetical protein LBG72_07400 [Spirochaetaceae bacterium]|jgi:hypothetical protein|nr:hypothetical protein [Spirochaetaceae bacterium]
MNTIPSTFSGRLPPYTVVGAEADKNLSGVSAVVLPRRGRMGRRAFFEELEKCGFDLIVSVENSTGGGAVAGGVEELYALSGAARFLLIDEKVSVGAKINAAASEVKSPLFFVLWDDQRISGIKAERIHERLKIGLKPPANAAPQNEMPVSQAAAPDIFSSAYKRLCTVPVMQNQALETVPTMNVPVAAADFASKKTSFFSTNASSKKSAGKTGFFRGKNTFECVPILPEYDEFPTLYPFDAAGVYDRARFIRLGGFDDALDSPYWQYLDLGLRAWLWGEEIRCDKPLRLSVEGQIHREDTTADASYRRFFLKNLAPVFRRSEKKITLETIAAASEGIVSESTDGGVLPLVYFFPFALKSGMGIKTSWRLFSGIRHWVKDNSSRFVTDSRTLFRNWLGKIIQSDVDV